MRNLITSLFGFVFTSLFGLAYACPDVSLSPSASLSLGGSSGIEAPQVTLGSDVDLGACTTLPSDISALGFTAAAASLAVTVEAGSQGDLHLGGRSVCDTVMLVRDPAGGFHFSDDTGSARQPLLNLPGAVGEYLVWLGSYDSSSDCEAQIAVSLGDQACPAPGAGTVGNPMVNLADGASLPLSAGGTLDLAGCADLTNLGLGTIGFTGAMPHFELQVAAGSESDALLSVPGTCDTSLLARDTSGTWYFNDDAEGSFNPELNIPAADLSGLQVWVGTYEASGCSVALDIQAQQGGASPQIAAGACPAAGTTAEFDLVLGDTGLVGPLDLAIGGSQDIASCGGALAETFPVGFFDGAPSLNLSVSEETPSSLQFISEGACDAVMLAVAPDGSWHFNDDTNGTDPALAFPAPLSGTYSVWVGTYGEEPCGGSLSVNTETLACPNPSLAANEVFAYDAAELSGGVRHPLVAGGYTNFNACEGALDVFGNGYFIDRPDFEFNLVFDSRQQIQFESDGTCDTVMLVQDPSGFIQFDDDSSPEEGSGALITTTSSGGSYKVWIGTFGEDLCEGGVTLKRGLFKE